ncbi:MAG: hypothetical protein FJW36_10605 [Acidobacteria bacterium]|nr:hypothetical protein [Acidobacteriota bacterium]
MRRRELLLLPFAMQAAEVVIPNGVYRDRVLRYDGKGMRVRAETPGGVVFTGASSLFVGGEGNRVEGLWFRDGAVPKAVITMVGKGNRVTQCAIENYNGASKSVDTKWVSIYGEANKFDHNYIAGKTNRGTTLVVWLKKGDISGARHKIYRNHFGPREPLGENGGETIRVGDSATSLQPGKCVVEENWFTRCDGEIEVISNKSCENVYRGNVFRECAGTLTLRHGNSCVVEGNVFLGEGYPQSGGVRIIGEDHVVERNFFERLTGTGSRAAISVMQGVANTPLNGYAQVKRAVIRQNTIVDCAEIMALSVKGAKTTLEPEDMKIESNYVVEKKIGRPSFIAMEEVGPKWRKSG